MLYFELKLCLGIFEEIELIKLTFCNAYVTIHVDFQRWSPMV